MLGYFRMQLKALKINGISIEGYKNVTYRIYSLLIVVGLIIMYPVLDFFELFKPHESADVVSDVFLYFTGGASAITKTLVMIANRIRFGKVLSKLEQKPFLPDPNRGGEAETKLINECVWITNTQTYVYWILVGLTVGVTILISFIKKLNDNSYRSFPYGPFTILNITNNFNYEVCWVYQAFGMSAFTAAFVSTDLLICAVLAHISYQFKVLQNFLRQMVEISYKRMIDDGGAHNSKMDMDASAIPWKYLHGTLKTAVSYHQAILDITSEMETAFSKLLLVAFLNTIIMICISIYHASKTVNDMQLMRYLGEMASFCLQVGLFSYWGEQVIQESQKVGLAAYESNFPGTDLRFQKAVALIIRRSQTPTVITAGKFTDIGMPTFAWILRASYSAFMVLRNNNTKNK